MPMPAITILFGALLMAVGVGTYIGAGEGATLSTFLLQMILGAVAMGLGVGAIAKKPMRMHLMHGAILLAVMGVIVPIVKLVAYIADLPRPEQMELVRVMGTVLVSGGYVYLAVLSFRKARAARKIGTTDKADTTPPPQIDKTSIDPAETTGPG